MWLVYLHFDDKGEVKTYHILTGSKAGVNELFKLAEIRGLSQSAKLVEYAAFYARGTFKQKLMIVPNFHFYEHAEFVRRWNKAVFKI